MSVEIYVSTDIEADGPIPGDFSMLALGSVVFDDSGKEISSFYARLHPLEGARQDPDTMAWWAKHPEAWAEITAEPRSPAHEVMPRYCSWLKQLPGKPVFVGYPASYDFMFVYWYLQHFAGESPFGFQALDIKTYAMVVLGTPFRGTTKRTMPKQWFADAPQHTHQPLDDAREQGKLFFEVHDVAGLMRDLAERE